VQQQHRGTSFAGTGFQHMDVETVDSGKDAGADAGGKTEAAGVPYPFIP